MLTSSESPAKIGVLITDNLKSSSVLPISVLPFLKPGQQVVGINLNDALRHAGFIFDGAYLTHQNAQPSIKQAEIIIPSRNGEHVFRISGDVLMADFRAFFFIFGDLALMLEPSNYKYLIIHT